MRTMRRTNTSCDLRVVYLGLGHNLLDCTERAERPNINDHSRKHVATLAGLSTQRLAYITMTVAPIRGRL